MAYSILIAEDEKDILELIVKSIVSSRYNFSTLIAPNGKVAFEIASEQLPDLILLDWNMPVMSGFEALKKIKSNEKTKDIPVIMVTAETTSLKLKDALEAGAVDYIKKPIDKVELIARVDTAFRILQYQKEIISHLEALTVAKKKITDSINYAQRIQSSLIPTTSAVKAYFPDSFLIYRPKDIVGGDFLWFLKREDSILFAVADCTGHGVPGAMLTMMGYSLLESITESKNILEPAEILTELHREIALVLNKSCDDTLGDGMDIAICKLNFNDNFLKYAGARRNLLILRNDEWNEIPGERYQVGGTAMLYEKRGVKIEFHPHTIEISNADTLFLYTDGLTDQNGGKDNRNFTGQRLKETILNFHKTIQDMHELGERLEKEFDDWKGNNSQRDDVLCLGIRI